MASSGIGEPPAIELPPDILWKWPESGCKRATNTPFASAFRPLLRGHPRAQRPRRLRRGADALRRPSRPVPQALGRGTCRRTRAEPVVGAALGPTRDDEETYLLARRVAAPTTGCPSPMEAPVMAGP